MTTDSPTDQLRKAITPQEWEDHVLPFFTPFAIQLTVDGNVASMAMLQCDTCAAVITPEAERCQLHVQWHQTLITRLPKKKRGRL